VANTMPAEVKRYMRQARPGDITYGNSAIDGTYVFPASLSMIGSGLVVLTYVIWPELRKVRYIEIMFYVGTNTFIASLGGALGPVPNYSPACWFQGIATNANFVIASCWITVLTYQLWTAVVYGRTVTPNAMKYIHLFIWTVPAIFSILPLTTSTYGNPNGYKQNKETAWCFVVTSTDDNDIFPVNREKESDDQIKNEILWDFFSFYAWIYANLMINLFFALTILIKLRDGDKKRTIEIRNSVYRLLLYPLIEVLCWSWTMVHDMQLAASRVEEPSHEKTSDGFAIFMPLISGFLFSVAFFLINAAARRKWARLALRAYHFAMNIPETTLEISKRISLSFMGANVENPLFVPFDIVALPSASTSAGPGLRERGSDVDDSDNHAHTESPPLLNELEALPPPQTDVFVDYNDVHPHTGP